MFTLIWFLVTAPYGAATSGTAWFENLAACEAAVDEIAKIGGVSFCVEDGAPGIDG